MTIPAWFAAMRYELHGFEGEPVDVFEGEPVDVFEGEPVYLGEPVDVFEGEPVDVERER